ncbi:TetR family transcriptional regulator [Burkholderia sp. THE68]|uniref:TetR/AcrR family transcriptional regulator n=1 Tax=Burkholderia sp. THE68 TaxID=758782 RepID=UPI0013181A86|nr:TetR/AcrR family transcriptional regulator [Burkholderia sp. THE68]BBU30325.1 TetR family transcriptional regulator [Burkholderia sp. THE68]
MGKKEQIIEAAKALLWEKGYEATSPREIQERSHSGQGSFYHHFPSKVALAQLVIEEVVNERIQEFEDAIHVAGSFRTGLATYIEQNTEPLLGCRVGRLVWDSAIQEEALRAPLARYFQHLERRIVEVLNEQERLGQLTLNLPADQISLMVLSAIQGSFAISRAMQISRAGDARASLMSFLELAISD